MLLWIIIIQVMLHLKFIKFLKWVRCSVFDVKKTPITVKWEHFILKKNFKPLVKFIFKVLCGLKLSLLVLQVQIVSSHSSSEKQTLVNSGWRWSVIRCQPLTLVSFRSLFGFVVVVVVVVVCLFVVSMSHLLLAWERVVVTRHISHDGLLIWPQGANDICPGNRGRGGEDRGEKTNAQE